MANLNTQIISKIEGKGNNIKTSIQNIAEIASYLNRDAQEILKFFGYELGAQTTLTNDKALVNGPHTSQTLQNILLKYIDMFILCKNCSSLETYCVYRCQPKNITQKCKTCGQENERDIEDKFTSFIVKHLSQETRL